MRKFVLLFIALCLHGAARGQTGLDDLDLSWVPQTTQASALRYWFDDDAGGVQTTDIVGGTHYIDVSSLLDGLHTIHCQVIDSEGRVAVPYSSVFLKVDPTQANCNVTAQSLRYWFDDDANGVQTSNIVGSTHSIDVSSLLDGLHTIHCQVIDSEGRVAVPYSSVFLKVDPTQANCNVTAQSLRYWFDDDANGVQTSNIVGGTHYIDVSSLLDGLHTIHCQVIDSEGRVAAPYSSVFLKMDSMQGSSNVSAKRLIYWFDDEQTTTSIDMVSGVVSLDATELAEGMHTIHYLVVCNDGSVTSACSSIFMRLNVDITSTTARSLRYWFDNETDVRTTDIVGGTHSIDVSSLLDGLHTIHCQVIDSEGRVAAPYSSIFLKVDPTQANCNVTAQSLRYWFDDETDVRTTSVADGTQAIDVSNLMAGLHSLHYQIVDSEGQLASVSSDIFLKMPEMAFEEGQNRITQYKYWLNGNCSELQSVPLVNTANPYKLIALLPVHKEPLRSSCFHFEAKDGQPMMYAKNDFRIRFCDAAGYWIDDSRQFVDYAVSRKVEPVGELQVTQTFSKIATNDVLWYTIQIAPGDTVAFKLSQPATVQVFAPSGEEVFMTSESASVKWDGVHTWEDGTYYVAVHDVTGSQSNMTLDYMHMDKYDVVDWDVHTVGNGGCSTITFKGNGFRDLYAVDLVIAPGDTIRSIDVGHESDAGTSVTFDFSGAKLGEYNAVFHFTQEDKHIANVVTVEDARDIELTTEVSFPSSFLRGTSTTYTIKITNKGNMTAYAVPIYMWLSTKSQDGISHIEIDGLSLSGLFDGIDTDLLSADDAKYLKDLAAQAGDGHHFHKLWSEDQENPNDDNCVHGNNFFTNIGPNEEKTIRLTVKAKEKLDTRVSVPKKYPPFDANGPKSSGSEGGYCCVKDKVECVASILADVTGVASSVVGYVAPGSPADMTLGVASCLADASSQIVSATGAVMCGDTSDAEKSLWDKIKDISNGFSIGSTLSGCASKLLPKGKLKSILEGISDIASGAGFLTGFGLGIDLQGCIEAFSTPVPNCPADVAVGGGTSTPAPPVDPNDIFGYLSEAGSKFIADSIAKVNYTIEFENDTTFATAAAHTIVIKDTLDSQYFDLAQFMPTGIRIGEHETFLDETDVITKNNVTSFVKTIDMRPAINTIAQVDGTFNQTTGIAEWRFTSLDPMTMEPTDELMQGILPVNYDGSSGIGEVMFDIGVKQGKTDGAEISNKASIVFDYEKPILTPTWTNIVDAVAPNSYINDLVMLNDTIVHLTAEGTDERSGVWKYTWYVQAGTNAPWWKEGETESPSFDYRIFEDIDYGFCVIVTDSAGNVERKVIERERGFITTANRGDANGNGVVEIGDVTSVLTLMATPEATGYNNKAADANGNGEIEIGDVTTILTIMAGN